MSIIINANPSDTSEMITVRAMPVTVSDAFLIGFANGHLFLHARLQASIVIVRIFKNVRRPSARPRIAYLYNVSFRMTEYSPQPQPASEL